MSSYWAKSFCDIIESRLASLLPFPTELLNKRVVFDMLAFLLRDSGELLFFWSWESWATGTCLVTEVMYK